MVNDIAVQDFVNAIKDEPTDTNTTYNATVSRVDKEGVVWVNIHGSGKETPTASTSSEVKPGDEVNVNWRNNRLYINGNYTNPSAGFSTVQPSIDFISELVDKDITVNSINAATGYIGELEAKNIKAEDISADHATIKELDVESMAAAVAYIGDLTAENITADDIIADHATIDDLDATYAEIDAANITDLSAQNAWVNKIMVQTGLIAHESNIFTLDAIQVNAANITAGTIDVNRLIVTVDGEKYLVEIDPTTHQPSYEKLDGGIVEPRTITADKIVAHDITVQEITTENLVGTNGWINLNQGKFFYTTNGSTWANTTNGIMWDGTSLKIKGDVNITAGNVYTKTESDTALSGKVGNNEVITKINASSEGVQIQAAKVDIAGAAVFNNYSTTAQMNTAIGTAVDGIEVGGRNLSLKTGTAQTLTVATSGNYWFNPAIYTTSDYGKALLADTSNTRFTVSYDYSITGVTGNTTLRMSLRYTSSGSYSIGTIISGQQPSVSAGSSSGHVSITFEPNSGSRTYGTNWMVLVNNTTAEKEAIANASLTISNFKFEIGTKATDWTPAPEDVQAEIDAKKSVHTLNTSYSYTYANILTYSAEGFSSGWNVASSVGVKAGDTVRLKVTVSDMSNAPVYIIGTVTAVNSTTNITMTSHGLDTTIIDGGNILTNSIGANQIKANAITANNLAIGGFDNYVTVTEKDASSIIQSGDTIENGWLKTRSGYSAQCPRRPRWTTNGEKYRVTGTVKAPAAGCFMFVIYARDSNGSNIANSANYRQVLAANTETNISTVITLNNAGYSTGVLSDILVCFCTTTTWSENFQSGYIKNLRCERISDGHENLLMDSQKMSAWYRGTGATLDTTGEFGVITLNGAYNAWTGRADSRPTMRTSILDGTPLWVSFEYKASLATDFQFNIAGSASAEGSLDTTRTKYKGIARTLPVATSWTKYSFEHPAKTLDDFTSGSGDVNSLHLRFYNNTDNSVLQIRKVKLEHGLSATDWTPSPEEQKTYITRIDSDGIRIHPASTTNDSVLINSTGMEIFKGGTAAANSIAKFGALSSSSNVLCIKNLNNVTATVSSPLVINELDSSASGTAITMTVQRKDIDTGDTHMLELSYVKGTPKSTYGISYDGANEFYDENSDYVAYFVKIKFYVSTASKTLRLGSTTTSNKGIVFGHRINNANTDTFSVDINGNVNSLGNIVCANIGDNNCVNGGTIKYNISTTSGTTKAIMDFSLEAGVYIVIARVTFPSNATGYRFINVSDTAANGWVASISPAINGTVTTLQFMQILAPTSYKTYHLNAHQNSGTTLTIPSAILQYVRIR